MVLLRSLFVTAVMVPGVLLLAAATAVAALLGRSPRQLHGYYLAAARLGFWVAGTSLHVRGLENLDAGTAYVIASNHESNWDPCTILAGLPMLVIRFVGKKPLMRIPVFGQALALSGNVTVDRSRTGADVRRIEENMSERAPEVSLLFFAEGTRARDGAYREFKKGAFATALRYQLPILPVAVAGTRAVWAPNSPLFRRGPVVIEIGTPIPVAGLDHTDRNALRDQAHEVVGKLRAQARAQVRALGSDPTGVD